MATGYLYFFYLTSFFHSYVYHNNIAKKYLSWNASKSAFYHIIHVHLENCHSANWVAAYKRVPFPYLVKSCKTRILTWLELPVLNEPSKQKPAYLGIIKVAIASSGNRGINTCRHVLRQLSHLHYALGTIHYA